MIFRASSFCGNFSPNSRANSRLGATLSRYQSFLQVIPLNWPDTLLSCLLYSTSGSSINAHRPDAEEQSAIHLSCPVQRGYGQKLFASGALTIVAIPIAKHRVAACRVKLSPVFQWHSKERGCAFFQLSTMTLSLLSTMARSHTASILPALSSSAARLSLLGLQMSS